MAEVWCNPVYYGWYWTFTQVRTALLPLMGCFFSPLHFFNQNYLVDLISWVIIVYFDINVEPTAKKNKNILTVLCIRSKFSAPLHLIGASQLTCWTQVLLICGSSLFLSSRRPAWSRTSARIRVRRRSRSSTSSSVAPVRRATASTPPDWPTCPRKSSSRATGKPGSLRGAPSACDSSSNLSYILCCLTSSAQCNALTLALCLPLQENLPVCWRLFAWKGTLRSDAKPHLVWKYELHFFLKCWKFID